MSLSLGLKGIAVGTAMLALLGTGPVQSAEVDAKAGGGVNVEMSAEPEVVMYKHPDCGCCGKWADHMRENGFAVKEISTLEVALVKSEAGVPEGLGSCHTATVGGYIVEGHVPASDVRRMLDEKPAIAGISAPGMPLGSPGMEGPYEAERYDVIGFDANGKLEVFASH